MPIDDDAAIVDGLRKRSEEAFSMFFEKWKDPLYGYLISLTRDRNTAEDLLQDVFIKVLANINAYKHRGRLKQWVFQIAWNSAVDNLRRTRRSRFVSLERADGVASNLEGGGPGPEAIASQSEMEEKVRKAVGGLPPEQRTVLHLRTKENLSFREIAEAMGSSLNTALGRMHYAVSALRKQLKETEEIRHVPENANDMQ
jgi:RNA polymerase sigma-70 factor (ECF subfamily)